LNPSSSTEIPRHVIWKTCGSRLKSLTPGMDIFSYTADCMRILAAEASSLDEEEQIDIWRPKLGANPDIALRVQDRFSVCRPTRLSEYVDIVHELFAPRTSGFREELKHNFQPDNVTATDYAKQIRKLATKYWVSPPTDPLVLSDIIDSMSSKHRDFMCQQLRTYESI